MRLAVGNHSIYPSGIAAVLKIIQLVLYSRPLPHHPRQDITLDWQATHRVG